MSDLNEMRVGDKIAVRETGKKLYCFDIDGTLTDRDSTTFYTEAEEWLRENSDVNVALCTNQGGPACHDAGWGFSDKFPSLNDVRNRLEGISDQVETLIGKKPDMFVAYGYKIKSNGQVIYPHDLPEHLKADHWRKPEPGMILAAVAVSGVTLAETVMIGDRDEDRLAAEAAGVDFVWADDFF